MVWEEAAYLHLWLGELGGTNWPEGDPTVALQLPCLGWTKVAGCDRACLLAEALNRVRVCVRALGLGKELRERGLAVKAGPPLLPQEGLSQGWKCLARSRGNGTVTSCPHTITRPPLPSALPLCVPGQVGNCLGAENNWKGGGEACVPFPAANCRASHRHATPPVLGLLAGRAGRTARLPASSFLSANEQLLLRRVTLVLARADQPCPLISGVCKMATVTGVGGHEARGTLHMLRGLCMLKLGLHSKDGKYFEGSPELLRSQGLVGGWVLQLEKTTSLPRGRAFWPRLLSLDAYAPAEKHQRPACLWGLRGCLECVAGWVSALLPHPS